MDASGTAGDHPGRAIANGPNNVNAATVVVPAGESIGELLIGTAEGLRLSVPNRILVSGGNNGATPGPGTFGIVMQLWF